MFGPSPQQLRKKSLDLSNRAVALVRAGRASEALPLLEAATQGNPTAAVWENLATVRGKLGQHQQAIDDFTRALQLNPSLRDSLVLRGKARKQIGDYYGAIEDFTRYIELDPANAFAGLICRANTYRDLSEHEAALRDYLLICQKTPNDAAGVLAAAECYHNLKAWQPALEMLTRGIALKPPAGPRRLYWRRSFAHEGLGDLRAALADAEAAIAVTEEPAPDMGPHVRRMNLLRRVGRHAEAQHERALIDAYRDNKVRAVAERGRFVWGALIMANMDIFSPGDEDRGGVVAFTFRRDIPRLGRYLTDLAAAIAAVKGTRAQTPEQMLLSKVTTNERVDQAGRVQAPLSMTGGAEVYCQSVTFHRGYFPTGRLEGRLFACAATKPPDNKIVHLPWSVGQRQRSLLGE